MQLVFAVNEFKCPGCEKTDSRTLKAFKTTEHKTEFQELLPKEYRCGHCGVKFCVTASIIISVSEVEEPAKKQESAPLVTNPYQCNDCGRFQKKGGRCKMCYGKTTFVTL